MSSSHLGSYLLSIYYVSDTEHTLSTSNQPHPVALMILNGQMRRGMLSCSPGPFLSVNSSTSGEEAFGECLILEHLCAFLAPLARIAELATGAFVLGRRESSLSQVWGLERKCLRTMGAAGDTQTHLCKRKVGCQKWGAGVFIRKHSVLVCWGSCDQIPQPGGLTLTHRLSGPRSRCQRTGSWRQPSLPGSSLCPQVVASYHVSYEDTNPITGTPPSSNPGHLPQAHLQKPAH